MRFRYKLTGPYWSQAEGYILGVVANRFKIAGSVIVYGIMASVIYRVIYYICQIL
ncbi:MAG: SpoVA/SpoVAEb family sporulation membrane protein [Clostridia bacterium]|nr:SpoVA/SpoVAEb family sporulation membrane protein [Clostridia bacterium]